MKHEKYIKALNITSKNRSNNCWKYEQKCLKLLSKLHDKNRDNEFIKFRDNIVIAFSRLTTNLNYIRNVKVSEQGRKNLLKLECEIFNFFKKEE